MMEIQFRMTKKNLKQIDGKQLIFFFIIKVQIKFYFSFSQIFDTVFYN